MTDNSKSPRSTALDADLEATIQYLRRAQENLRTRHVQMRELQARIQASRARYHDLFNSAPVGYVSTDSAGRIVEANRTATALLGASPAICGQSFAHFIWLEDRSRFQENFDRCRRRQRVRPFEIHLRRLDSARLPVQVALLRAKDFSKAASREYRIIIVDLSELKKAQIGLEDAKRLLEQRVEERTRELRDNMEKLAEEAARRVRLEDELLQISERERRRFGQDLHDDICQALTGLALELGGFSRQLAKDENPRSGDCHRLAVALGDLVRQTRRIAHGLHPVGLSGGLAHALEELIATISPRISCHLHLPRVRIHLPPEVELTLYRITQEALANVLKHAHASRSAVRLQINGGGLLLSIEDDGIGLPTSPPPPTSSTSPPPGMGLDILGYRARSIGATVVVENHSRGGVRVTCHVPKSLLLPSPSLLRKKTDENQRDSTDS